MTPSPSPRTRAVGALLGLVALTGAALTTTGLAAPSSAATPALAAPAALAAASSADLRVSPTTYVGGQRLTWSGHIGASGRRTVHLQRNLGRPGDAWKDVEDSSSTTDADGRFSFTFPAPTMFGIKFRVAGDGRTTPAMTFNARSQDVVLTTSGRPVAGRSFEVLADTAPTTLQRRPDLPGPVFSGRKLTLQHRVLTSHARAGYESPWRSVATTTTDSQGHGTFRVTVDEPGTVTYRVRQEDLTSNGHEIGWFPSFPTEVDVAPPGSSGRSATTVSRGAARTTAPADTSPSASPESAARTGVATPARSTSGQGAGTNASSTFGWGQALWDFDWPYGESLTTDPYRGSRDHGWWLDTSTGSGRADLHNGALKLDSQRENKDGPGDYGSTGVTLRSNASTYGRWEMRLRMKSSETNAREYRTLIELVPDRVGDYDCGGNTILVAGLAAHGSGYRFGVRSGDEQRKWMGTRQNVRFNNETHHFAVEVAGDHLTWFLDGTPVGTVKDRTAIPDVPMTMRFRMVGKGSEEMNRTQAIADWARGFPIQSGEQVTRGGDVSPKGWSGGC